MFAHELATLNEYKEENRELKSTCEALRKRNDELQKAGQGTALALSSLVKAARTFVPNDLFDTILKRADQLAAQ